VGMFLPTRRSRMCAAITICVGVAAGAPASASEQRFTYRVDMPPYGTIGTYRNVVQNDGKETTITTEGQIKVSLIGVVLYRLDISRVEHQVADRLVYFQGLTSENGNSVRVEGRAVGEYFIITSPSGIVTAPRTIRTSDPWSLGAPGTDMVFMPDTGTVTRVHRGGGEQTSITIDGTSMRVRRYQINTADGREQYEVWMDDQRTPVMFNIVDRDGTTTFTLVR